MRADTPKPPAQDDRGDQHTVPLDQAVARAMACLGDLREDGKHLFTPEQARESINDLVGLLPQMSEGARRQYGLHVDRAVMDQLAKLQAMLRASPNRLPPEAPELAKACMKALLGKSF